MKGNGKRRVTVVVKRQIFFFSFCKKANLKAFCKVKGEWKGKNEGW